jgi:hypothetical protein
VYTQHVTQANSPGSEVALARPLRGRSDAAPEPGPLYSFSNGQTVAPPECRTGWWHCKVHGDFIPARCGANWCPWCGPINALRITGAIALAGPERLLTLTQVGESWATVRVRMRRLRHRLVNDVGAVQWVWSVEPNPRGTGHHVHAEQYGAFVPVRRLSALARREGMGQVVDIRRIRMRVDVSSRYLVKLAADAYGTKLARGDVEQLGAYLRANGGRQMVHASRGFWRDQDGRPLSGVAEARKIAQGPSGGHQWAFYRSHELAS